MYEYQKNHDWPGGIVHITNPRVRLSISVTLSVQASHAGNWSYQGNRMIIAEAGGDNLIQICENTSTCIASFPITSSGNAIQYITTLFDRNDELVMSSLSPVIYIK